jgi:hypothetical protein
MQYYLYDSDDNSDNAERKDDKMAKKSDIDDENPFDTSKLQKNTI